MAAPTSPPASSWIQDPTKLRLLGLGLFHLLAGGGLLLNNVRNFDGNPPDWLPFLLIGIGVLFFLEQPPDTPPPAVATTREMAARPDIARWRRFGGWAALSIGLTAVILWQIPQLGREDSYTLSVILWLLAGTLLGVGTYRLSRPLPPLKLSRQIGLFVAGLALLSLLLRLVGLTSFPLTLGGDEASQGLEAVRVLNGQIRNPFSTGWLGVPTMSFFFNSLTISWLGQTTLALRLPWVLVGSAAVVVTFFLVRRMAGIQLAVISSLLLATYHYHIHYSRLGSNQIADTLFVALALWFTLRALDSQGQRPFDWFLVGMTCALALYFYAGARLAFVVVLAVVGYEFVRAPRLFWHRHATGLVVGLLTFAIVGGPMLQYAYRFPDEFNARVNDVGIFQSGWLEREVDITSRSELEILWDQFQRSFLAFNYYPDRRVWYGLPTPLLDPLFGLLFLLGLGIGSLRLLSRSSDQRLALMVAWWWGGMLMGGVLTESPPSSQRLITLSIPTCFFIALGLQRLSLLASAAFRRFPRKAVVWGFTALFALVSLSTYFVTYRPQRIYGGQHAEMATRLAPLLNAEADGVVVRFVGPPHMYWNFATIPYLAPTAEGADVEEVLTAPPPADWPTDNRDWLFVFVPERQAELALVKQTYPAGEEMALYSDDPQRSLLGIVYRIPHP